MEVVWISEKGPEKELNQDYLKVDEKNLIFAISDGVGNYEKSHIASKWVVETAYESLVASINAPDFDRSKRVEVLKAIEKAFHDANSWLVNAIENETMNRGTDTLGGVTLDLGMIIENRFYGAHVGSGRIYSYTKRSRFLQLTEDDCLGEHPNNVMTKWVGWDDPDEALEIQKGNMSIESGSRILLCTDGIAQYVKKELVGIALHKLNLEPSAILDYLKWKALGSDCKDDISAILYTHEKN